jgi:Flp pilus assembly protein TadD
MMKKIVIRGPWHERDRKYIADSEDLHIIHFPSLNSTEDYDSFTEAVKQADLVIFALFGSNLVSHFEIPELLPFFHDNSIKKVYWTQDAQHEWGMGLEYQRWFHKYYLNYSGYLDKYDGVETCWLPSCFFSIGIDELTELISFPREIERDVIFPYTHYSLDDRTHVAKSIREKLSDYGLNYYLGNIEFGLPYLRSIQESKICLNISTLGSLNIRNFEVLALNRILLTERVADHDSIKMDISHTYFFKRDLTDFDDALNKALNDTATDIRTSDDILNNHMLVHRYVEIINNELNTQYKVQNIDIRAVGETMQTVRNIKELLGTEKFEEAGRIIDQAIERYPNSPDLRNLKGEFFLKTGKIEEATKVFLYIEEHWPYHVETLNNIAIILCFNEEWDKAKKLLRGALRISPSNKSVLENLKFVQNEILASEAKRFLQHDNYFEANNRLEKVLASDNQHIEALNLLAAIHIKRGNLEEAKKSLSLVLEADPANEEAKENLRYINQQNE